MRKTEQCMKVDKLNPLTFPEKMLQLISAAQWLGVEFRVDTTEQVVFIYDGTKEVFNTVWVEKEPWCLDASWEPWFFSVLREKKESEALLASARTKMREAMKATLTDREREIFTSWLKGDHGVTV